MRAVGVVHHQASTSTAVTRAGVWMQTTRGMPPTCLRVATRAVDKRATLRHTPQRPPPTTTSLLPQRT